MKESRPPKESIFENGKDTGNPLHDLKALKRLTSEAVKGFKADPIPHGDITARLLEMITPVNFMELAGLEQGKEKLKRKHQVVIPVEQVLKLARKSKWDICQNGDFIYLFNGAYWSVFDAKELKTFLGEAAEKMGVDVFDAKHYSFRDQLYKQFLALANLPTPELPKDKVLINLKDGTFEIDQSGKHRLRDFDRSDFLTYQLPFNYDPDAIAPLFSKYLDRVLPDTERQKILAEYLGFVFIRHGNNALKEEKALILYGSGANGKSVFFEIVNALLGSSNVSSHPLDLLTNPQKGESYRGMIANKLVNYASEINGNLETSIFKQMVSGEPISARLLYGQPFEIKQYAKLIFNCNELPKDVEHSNAFFRRFLIVPFDVTIPESEQDKRLHTKIIEQELSGVFNWVLEGLNRLLAQRRFSDCEAAKRAVEQYKTESNSIKLFLEENGYQASQTDYRLIKELYPEYRGFCYEDGMTAFKKVNFSKQLEAMGVRIDREPGTGQKVAYLKKESLF